MKLRLAHQLVLFTVALPAFAIVIPSSTTGVGQDFTASDYLAPYGAIKDGINLNGVVLVNTGGVLCSGALVGPTQVLAAAHCFGGGNVPTIVDFLNSGNTFDAISGVSVSDPGYLGDPGTGADLAIINLSQVAPAYATVYQLFTGNYTSGDTIMMAGFGYTGAGDTGETLLDVLRRAGENAYDTNGNAIYGASANLLLGDFDNGTGPNNLFGNTGVVDEVDLAHGDSGGPSFYNGKIIGVHDIIDCAPYNNGPCNVPPSVNANDNSYYGQLFGDTSVAGNLTFLNGTLTPEPSSWCLCFAALALFLTPALRNRRPVPVEIAVTAREASAVARRTRV